MMSRCICVELPLSVSQVSEITSSKYDKTLHINISIIAVKNIPPLVRHGRDHLCCATKRVDTMEGISPAKVMVT